MLCPLLLESEVLPLPWAAIVGVWLLEEECDLHLDISSVALLVVDGRRRGELGLALDAEEGLLVESSRDELCLDVTVWEVTLEDDRFLDIVGALFGTDEDLAENADVLDVVDGVDGLWVGVADLEADFKVAETVDLAVGVEERELALTGVEDLAGIAAGLAEANDAREGVEALEGFVVEGSRCCLVGVAALEAVNFLTSADGLPLPAQEGLLLGKEAFLLVAVEGCTDDIFCEVLSSRELVLCNIK